MVVILCMIAMILGGCKQNEEAISENKLYEERVLNDGLGSFIEKLDEAGFDSEYDGIPMAPVFNGEGIYFEIDDPEQRIVVFVYNDAEMLREDRESIDETGYSVTIDHGNGSMSTTNYSWVAPPHFYLHENMLIQYIGDDKEILDFLNMNCEMKIAGF